MLGTTTRNGQRNFFSRWNAPSVRRGREAEQPPVGKSPEGGGVGAVRPDPTQSSTAQHHTTPHHTASITLLYWKGSSLNPSNREGLGTPPTVDRSGGWS